MKSTSLSILHTLCVTLTGERAGEMRRAHASARRRKKGTIERWSGAISSEVREGNRARLSTSYTLSLLPIDERARIIERAHSSFIRGEVG